MKKLIITALLATALFGCEKEDAQAQDEFCECTITSHKKIGGTYREVGTITVMMPRVDGSCAPNEGFINVIPDMGDLGSYDEVKCK